MTTEDQKRPVVPIGHDLHKKAKSKAVELGVTLQALLDDAISLWLSQPSRHAKLQKSLQK